MGGGQLGLLGHLWSSHDSSIDAYIMAYATLVGHRDVQSAVGAILGPYHLISTLHWCHYSSCDFGGLAKCLPEKQTSKHLTFDSLGKDSY